MKCENCGKCCGCILLPLEIFHKNKNKNQVEIIKKKEIGEKVFVLTEDLSCIFLNRKTKKCEIYEQRPQICRDHSTKECSKWLEISI